MCKAIEEIRQIGREEGREEGMVLAYSDVGFSTFKIANKLGITEEEVAYILQEQVIK